MKRAFSLVELSIVLVILGLLVGGILAGKSLIRASELRSVGSDIQKYKTAFFSFKDRYFAIPGDMANAESVWGTFYASDTNCRANDSTSTPTCNGDGDGSIDSQTTRSREMFRAWQHLANAGLVEGQFTGSSGPAGTYDAVIGSNVPASKFGKNGFSVVGPDMHNGGGYYANLFPPKPFGHYLIYGSYSLNGLTWGNGLTPEDAWNIDTKLDDGTPGNGSITTVFNSYNGSCASTSTASSAEYRLSITILACALHISIGL